MNEEFSKMLSELIGYPVDVDFNKSFEGKGIDATTVIGLMLCSRLDRIAQLLGDVSKADVKELLDKQADEKWMKGMF